MQIRAKRGSRVFALLLSLIMAVTMTTSLSLSTEPSYAAAAETVTISLVDKAGEEATLATWTYDNTNATYIEKDGTEVGIVQTFDDPLVYTGINKKPDPRCLSVTTKGILLEDFYDYSEALAGMDLRGDTKLYMEDETHFNDEFTYDQYWGLERYCYLDWYYADEYSETDMGSQEAEVPATLAINGYHNARNNEGTVTVEELVSKADSENSLRISTGMQKNGNKSITPVEGTSTSSGKTTDINEGNLSVKNVNYLQFTPVYYPISVTDGTAIGEAGTDLAYTVDHATVTTSDNYFTAAKGETVALSVETEAGYLATVTAATADDSIDVDEEDGFYLFDMPGEAVTLSVVTEKDMSPIVVTSAEELAAVAKMVNGGNDLAGRTVSLDADIDLSGIENWTPIGTETNPFTGTFDGAGHVISGLNIATDEADYQGLFGNNAGTLKDFSVAGTMSSTSANSDFYGGVAGFNSGTIEDVYSTVDITGKAYNVGGIAGLSTSGIWCTDVDGDRQNEQHEIEGATGLVQRCSWTGATLSASNKVGGIVGENAGYVKECFSGTGTIAAPGSSKGGAGGIVGRNGCNNEAYETGYVDSCYSYAAVGSSGDRWFGGIVGFQNCKYGYSEKTDVSATTNCYFAGSIVKGYSSNWGPIIGNYDSSSEGYSNNYSLDGINCGDSNEITKGIVKTDAEMKEEAFAELLGDAFQVQCGYPALSWETPKEHTEGEPQDTETYPATYDEGAYHFEVVNCTECGLELSRSEEIYDSKSLSEQAEDALNAYEEAQAALEEAQAAYDNVKGSEDAVAAAQAVLEAATALEEAAEAAAEATQVAADAAEAEGLDESIVNAANQAATDAAEAVEAAVEAIEDAAMVCDDALDEANSVKETKDAATLSMLTLDQSIGDASQYKTDSYNAYKETVDTFKALVNDSSATKQKIIDARSAITKAYVSLEKKDANTMTAQAKTVKVKVKKLKKKAQTVSDSVAVSGQVGTVSYKGVGVNKKSKKALKINANTGQITVKKKTKKGTYKMKVTVTDPGNGQVLGASKTVTVVIKVKKK